MTGMHTGSSLFSEGNMEVGDGGISTTVEVRGLSKKTSQELMEMYFENSRRSGGGDVEEVMIKDEVAYITFKEAEGAYLCTFNFLYRVITQFCNESMASRLFHGIT